MKIGNYEFNLLKLGGFRMDGGALFGIVPRKLWTRAYPHVDEDNRVQLATYALLIQGEGVTIVVDAGVGEKLDAKGREIFAVGQPPDALTAVLAGHGLVPVDVTHFVYTHLHFDHAGGATVIGSNGGPTPLFPNAKHFVQAEHLAWARNPSDKDRASFQPANWEPIAAAGMLVELQGDTQLLPGVEVRTVHGHTPGLQMILIHGDGTGAFAGGLLFSVDLFPTAAHLPAHYIAAFDNHPMVALEEKRKIAAEAHEKGWAVVFGHDPFTPCAQLRPGVRGYEVGEVYFREK